MLKGTRPIWSGFSSAELENVEQCIQDQLEGGSHETQDLHAKIAQKTTTRLKF